MKRCSGYHVAHTNMQKAFYYIGANNETGKLEKEKALSILATHFEGFTAFEVVGYWHSIREKTLKVEAVTDKKPDELARIGKELREKLQQESVMLEITQSNIAFIQ